MFNYCFLLFCWFKHFFIYSYLKFLKSRKSIYFDCLCIVGPAETFVKYTHHSQILNITSRNHDILTFQNTRMKEEKPATSWSVLIAKTEKNHWYWKQLSICRWRHFVLFYIFKLFDFKRFYSHNSRLTNIWPFKIEMHRVDDTMINRRNQQKNVIRIIFFTKEYSCIVFLYKYYLFTTVD